MQKLKKVLVTVLVIALTVASLPLYSNVAMAKAKKMKINKKKITLYIGKTKTYKVKNKKKSAKVKWKSSNKKVAKVSKKGKVKAIKAGKATITAKVGKKKFKCKVTVKVATPETTVANKKPAATVKPAQATTKADQPTQGPTQGQVTTKADQPTQGPTQGQVTTKANQTTQAQTTTQADDGDYSEYDAAEFLADGAQNGALSNVYKVVVVMGNDVRPNNIQNFQGIDAIHVIFPDADIKDVNVNGKPSTGKVEGAGLFINLNDLDGKTNEVVVSNNNGVVRAILHVFNAKGDASVNPTQAQVTTKADQPTQAGQTTQGSTQNQPTQAGQTTQAPTQNQPTTLSGDTSVAQPFGVEILSSDNNTIVVVWGRGDADYYRVYVDGALRLNNVECAAHRIENVPAGKHTVAVTAIKDGKESVPTLIDAIVTGNATVATTKADQPTQAPTQAGQTTQAPTQNQPTQAQVTTKTPDAGDYSIYDNVAYLGDGAQGGALTDMYKAVVVSGGVKGFANVQTKENVVGIYTMLDDADIGKTTVNGQEVDEIVEGAGMWINIADLTKKDNEVVIYNGNGTQKGVVRVFYKNGTEGGQVVNPTQAPTQAGQTTQAPTQNQPTQPATQAPTQPSMGNVDYSNAEYLGDGAQGGALSNTYKVVVVQGTNVTPNNVQTFKGTDVIHVILGSADVKEVTVNGNASTGFVEGAGLFINLNDLTQQSNQVIVKNNAGQTTVVLAIYNGKVGGSQNPTQQGGNQPTQFNGDFEQRTTDPNYVKPTYAQATTAVVNFTTDSSLPKPFGLVVKSSVTDSTMDDGIISVVWGAGEINCYNVYVDGKRVRTKVQASGQTIPVQREGNHTINIATVSGNRESEYTSYEIQVKGTAPEETTDYPENLKPQRDPSIPNADGKMVMQLNNNTAKAWNDNEIYWVVLGKNANHELCYLDLNGNLVKAGTNLNDANTPVGNRRYASSIVHKLSDRNYVHLPAIESGRMYISYGEPVYITFNEGGYAGPDVNNATDPNAKTLFEYFEFTTESINGTIKFHGNTTRVDFFSFPYMIRLTDSFGGYDRCVGDIGSRSEIFNSYLNSVSDPFKTLVDNYRIMAPCKTTFNEGRQYGDYFDAKINEFWTKYASQDLVFNCEGGEFRGRVNGNKMYFTKTGDARQFIIDRPTTQDVLEGRGAFNKGSSNDENKTQIEKVIEAQLCAAFNRGIATEPEKWAKVSTYYKNSPCNEYSEFFHQHSVSGRAYGFCYDDVYDQSTLVECGNADSLVIDLNW